MHLATSAVNEKQHASPPCTQDVGLHRDVAVLLGEGMKLESVFV